MLAAHRCMIAFIRGHLDAAAYDLDPRIGQVRVEQRAVLDVEAIRVAGEEDE